MAIVEVGRRAIDAERKPTVFISYRRQDSAGHAGRLADSLIARLGREHVFVDVDSIAPGQDFVAAIRDAVNRSDVLLVVIGQAWLTAATDDGVRRLDVQDDFVRLEIESAFRGGITIVPILVQGASMPADSMLPDSLRRLSRCNAVMLRDGHWSREVDHLVEKLGAATDAGTSAPPARNGASTVQPRRRMALPPALLDETIGRDEDLAALQRMILTGTARLITIVGPGGVGKTRLATELGHRLVGEFRDGVAFAPLADAEKAADVAPTICAALALREDVDGPLATLDIYLRDRHMLLVCDNFEHVVDAAATLSTLLAGAPGLHVIVSSRQRLGVRGEHVYRLEPFPQTAQPDSPAVALFIARVRASDPDFDPSPDERADIEVICAGCDGLPLAIELAAARIRVLTVAQLRDRIADPLPELQSGARDAPPRHQTLRATIASSVDALDRSDYRALADLTVFRGGFTVVSAAAVTNTSLDEAAARLDSLLGRSLVHRRAGSGGQHRFDLLETIRSFLGERMGQDDLQSAQRRHAGFYLHAMGDVPDARPGHHTAATWVAQLLERANIRAAIRWAHTAGEAILFADLVNSAADMWDRLGPRDELDDWLQRVIEDPSTAPGRVVDALLRRTYLCEYSGDVEAASHFLADAERLAETSDAGRRAWVALYLCFHACQAGDHARALMLLTRAERAVESAGSPDALLFHLQVVVLVCAETTGDHAAALRAQGTLLQMVQSHPVHPLAVGTLNNVCELGLQLGDYAQVIAWADEGVQLAEAAEDLDAIASLISQRGLARLEVGDLELAYSDLYTAVDLHAQTGSAMLGLDALVRLAAWYASANQHRTAAVLLSMFEAAAAVMAGVDQPLVRQVRERHLADLPTQLGPAYATATSEGSALFEGSGVGGVLSAALKVAGNT